MIQMVPKFATILLYLQSIRTALFTNVTVNFNLHSSLPGSTFMKFIKMTHQVMLP